MSKKTNFSILLIILAVAGLVMFTPSRATAATLDVRISNDADDCHQKYGEMQCDDDRVAVGHSDREAGFRF